MKSRRGHSSGPCGASSEVENSVDRRVARFVFQLPHILMRTFKKHSTTQRVFIKDVLNVLFNGAVVAHASLLSAARRVWTHGSSAQLCPLCLRGGRSQRRVCELCLKTAGLSLRKADKHLWKAYFKELQSDAADCDGALWCKLRTIPFRLPQFSKYGRPAKLGQIRLPFHPSTSVVLRFPAFCSANRSQRRDLDSHLPQVLICTRAEGLGPRCPDLG